MSFNKQFIVWIIVVGIVCGIIGHIIPDGDLTDAEVNDKIAKAVNQSIYQKNAEIETLKGLIEMLEKETEEPEIIGYLIDKLFLNAFFEEDVFSDREVSTLFDGEVEFDGKDYDAEERLTLSGFELRANDNDFEGIPYLVVYEGAIKFELVFDEDLNTSLIGEDEETLTFSLFGEEVEVSEWNVDEITFTRGKEVFLEQGESVTVDEKVIVLKYVTDDAVYVEVDGVGKSIDDGDIRSVNDVEIKVKDVFASDTYNVATLIVGTDIKEVISNSDKYEEDSIWEWIIGANTNTIGLVLVEKFTELDEDFNALTKGDKICLPNDYVCVQFNGMVEEATEEYYFELDGDFVRVKGNFEFETKDYDEIYISNDGSIYENDDTKDYIGEQVRLGDSEIDDIPLVLKVLGSNITIGDFKVNLNLNWTNVGTGDEDYLTNYGILVINPEDSAEDQEFNIFVPEEKLEGSITLV